VAMGKSARLPFAAIVAGVQLAGEPTTSEDVECMLVRLIDKVRRRGVRSAGPIPCAVLTRG